MEVNFNNLRKQALYSYHRITEHLNEAKKEREKEGHEDGRILIDPEDIQRDMDDLRMQLFTIACTYMPDDEKFKDVSEEAGEIAWFNNEDENKED